MAKKSFFSRLVGNDIVEENPGDQEINNFNFEEEENLIEQAASPFDYMEEEESFSLDEQIAAEEDWSPEYEGQLMVDVYQTKDDIIIQTIVAGVDAEDIDITIANDKVTIEGERKKKVNVREEDYFYQECYWGSFSRSVVLPVDVDSDNVEAKVNQGILTVILPKAEKAKVRKIQVKKA